MSSERNPLSWTFGIALSVHGLIHLMGVALLLELEGWDERAFFRCAIDDAGFF